MPVNTTAVAEVPFEEVACEFARIELYGAGNALLVHVGALQRINELGLLRNASITVDSQLGEKEQEIVDRWKQQCGSNVEFGNVIGCFGPKARRLRKKTWFNTWVTIARMDSRQSWSAKLMFPSREFAIWSAEAPKTLSLHISDERRRDLVGLVTSTRYLTESAMDYLVDWGYATCDAALCVKLQIPPTQRAITSPNRLFYRQFSPVSESIALQVEPSREPRKESSESSVGHDSTKVA
jgi:hypothetical protein